MLEDGAQGLRQPVHARLLARRIRARSRPERDALGVELAGDVDGTAEELDADRPTRGVRVHERGIMLEPGIEQEPGARLDHSRQTAPVEQRPDRLNLARQRVRVFERIEGACVERDRHALVSLLGQQLDGVGEAMMGQAVRVVSESHEKGR